MEKYIIHGADILSFDPARAYLSGHALQVENGIISKIAAYEELKDEHCEFIDASGKILMPGLINAHHHFYSTFVTGLGKAAPSQSFDEVLENLWWRLDKKLTLKDSYMSALISMLNAIKKGCTTIIDHHASPYHIPGSLNEIARAVKDAGIRASLCYEVSDRDGLPRRDEGIRENAEFIKAYQAGADPHLRALFGMHAAFTLSDESLSKISALVSELNCGVHIHAAEAQSDQDYNIQHYGKHVVERLKDFDLINDKSILAHGVHLTPKEMMIVAEQGAAIVTNPQSNLNNAVGIADVCKMAELGITVGLGTDAMTVNMLQELRVGLWAQHLRQENPNAGFMEIASTLLFNNPAIAQKYWGAGHGTLVEGAVADMILVDYDPHTPLNAESWIGHVIYGLAEANVSATICAGNILMWDGELLLGFDEAELKAESRALAKALWERF
ncbi:MAG: putative aminohydrolase SsnA [Candidatus Cloacimonetes bacterium]|jgi:putative selenium metabolism protein SsnA|nr:putative aminohydrolase SsnA [Candidatus Cloacimonadota bacterium]MCB5286617.1 putative aminohydrolase SsnA [Candidatus Cloacimonadota bacterium]MCK9185009.1 putative aminohydrolase SsnA [Candidatus Cloacimonadota bacterium]MCK9583558.1 putative aminohydrolase SsnA [Candidatus Cloacimonadota bacterium]MDY0228937.1 putative aminohydrolase SsnA [Candidatus Cloacimonadaceae bacterium]